MMDPPVVPIVQAGAPVLRSPAYELPPERILTDEIQGLFTTMIATMRAAPGVGLAAPQIGIPLRIIVVEDPEELIGTITPEERREREREPFPVRVLVNPVLHPRGNERATFFEGCLSVDGYVALVERSLEVEVKGLDERGQPVRIAARGWPARIFLHELDHLDGVLYIDRMKTRSFASVEQAKARFSGKSIEEIERMLGI